MDLLVIVELNEWLRSVADVFCLVHPNLLIEEAAVNTLNVQFPILTNKFG
jgi:hypothetical protein